MKRIGVDVGGTFTDLIYVDDEAGAIRVHKLPTTPDDPSQGTIQGVKELAEDGGRRALLARPGLPRDDDRDEHRDRAQRRASRDADDRGLPRHPPHRAPQEAAQLLELPGSPVAAVPSRPAPLPAPPSPSGSRATARSSSRSTRSAPASRCAGAEGGRRRGRLRLLPLLVPEPRARGAGRGDRPRGVPEAFLPVSSEVIPQYREYERFSTVGLNATSARRSRRTSARLGRSSRRSASARACT